MCFICKNEDEFYIQEDEIEQEYHGKIYKFLTPLTYCNKCGWECMSDGQADELIRRLKTILLNTTPDKGGQ